ncbi:MAG TPA: hypothetical protein VMB66_00755 [Candidatus Acidoferrales bacterium]|nr:hypothetical protein [Candidatus Acidoferrales bacterium]
MSIDPVSAVALSPDAKPPISGIRRAESAPDVADTTSPRPSVVRVSDQGSPGPSSNSELPQAGEDEVQVQQGSQTDGRIVIKYLDPSGNLILQIPSSQVLGLARAIDQALNEQQKSRASEGASSAEGAKRNGH